MKRSEMTLTKGQILGDESNHNPPAHDAVNGILVDATTEMREFSPTTAHWPQPGENPASNNRALLRAMDAAKKAWRAKQ